MSTVSSNFANFTFCTSGIASSIEEPRSIAICLLAAANFLPCFFMNAPVVPAGPRALPPYELTDDVEAHRTRRARDRLDRRLQRVGVQIRHLQAGDVLDLLG